MAHRLDGKYALVTGATGGLGEAISVALAEAGAKLILNYRGPAPTDEFLNKLEALTGERPRSFDVDVSDELPLSRCSHRWNLRALLQIFW